MQKGVIFINQKGSKNKLFTIFLVIRIVDFHLFNDAGLRQTLHRSSVDSLLLTAQSLSIIIKKWHLKGFDTQREMHMKYVL